jgi:hypothetical protein
LDLEGIIVGTIDVMDKCKAEISGNPYVCKG